MPYYFYFLIVICILVISNFRKNGFALEEDPYAPPGQHFRLKAVPFSKNITFGVEGSCCFQIFSVIFDCKGTFTLIFVSSMIFYCQISHARSIVMHFITLNLPNFLSFYGHTWHSVCSGIILCLFIIIINHGLSHTDIGCMSKSLQLDRPWTYRLNHKSSDKGNTMLFKLSQLVYDSWLSFNFLCNEVKLNNQKINSVSDLITPILVRS